MAKENYKEENAFVAGSDESGLCIALWQNQTYEFNIDGISVQVVQTADVSQSGLNKLELLFKNESPARFSLEILIPENTVNACVMLNGQVLIMPMAADWPEKLMPLELSACQQKGEAVSTLRAGEFQKINFRWQKGDKLSIYCV
ncbi:MAG: hypothetical protein GX028_08990 [Clostridiaceae bacterium]|nr:hypothetical protein [Clostridiaceae bacterium]